MSTSYLSWRICHILKDKLQHIWSLRNFAFAHVPEFSPDRGIGARGKTNYAFFPLYFFGKYLEIAEIWVWKQKICSKTQYFQATNTWLEPKSLFFYFACPFWKPLETFPHFSVLSKGLPPPFSIYLISLLPLCLSVMLHCLMGIYSHINIGKGDYSHIKKKQPI